MCLLSKDKTYDPPMNMTKARIGYKVFRLHNNGTVSNLYFNTGRKMKLGGGWRKAKAKLIGFGSKDGAYESGFHVLSTMSDAVTYTNGCLGDYVVCQVQCKNVTCEGLEYGGAKAFVCQNMKIDRIVLVSPTNMVLTKSGVSFTI